MTYIIQDGRLKYGNILTLNEFRNIAPWLKYPLQLNQEQPNPAPISFWCDFWCNMQQCNVNWNWFVFLPNYSNYFQVDKMLLFFSNLIVSSQFDLWQSKLFGHPARLFLFFV
jgi:hypothetical protein